ncbi:hypothetical protein RB601_001634 [Gaeumannomyces tritici]
MLAGDTMAPKRDLLRHSSSAEPRGGFLTTVLFSSPPDLGRRQNDGNRDRDRSGNGNGGSSNNGGRNGNGGGDSENRNGRNSRGGGGDSNDSGRGENGRGGGGNGGGGGRGDGGGGGSGSNRGDGGSGRFGNNRNDGGSDGGSRNRDGGGGDRNNDNTNNNNNGNRFRNGGNRNGDGRDRDTTTAQTAPSAAPTSSPASGSASAPPTTGSSAQVPISAVSSIPDEVNGAISASSAPSAPTSTTTGPAATISPSAGSSAPVAGSETAAPAPSATLTSDPTAATPSPPTTTGDVTPGSGTSSGATSTASVSIADQSSSSLASGASSASIPTLNPVADANIAGIGIGDGASRDPQWQKSGNEMSMGQREVMSGTTERVLISVGSIGAFISISFLAWIIWRTARKSKRRKQTEMQSDYRPSSSHQRPGISQRLAAKLPFLRSRQQQHWLNITDNGYGDQKDRPLTFGPSEVPVAPIKGFYGSEKVDSLQAPLPTLASPQSQQSPPVQSPPPQLRLQTQQLSGATTWSPTSPATRQQEQMGGQTWPVGPNQWQQMQFQAAFAAAGNAYSPGGLSPGTGTGTSMFTHQATGSFSSTNAAQFGATTPSSDVGGTWRSRMGPANGYNQSSLARQPSNAYDPAKRQVGRASALSSLSSGFGDGDIVVPQLPRQPLAGPAHGGRAVGGNESEAQQYLTEARVSWASRRDTVYTESSDDAQPRYRTVTSWVRQQSGRVRRAEQRGARSVVDGASDGGVEGPSERAMPPEPQFNMMMDDGQAPRSPETMSGAGVLATRRQQE